MGASNFHNVNASKIYACSVGDSEECRFYDSEDLFEQVKYSLAKSPNFVDFTPDDPFELRSYPSTVVGSLRKVKRTKSRECEVFITAVIRYGYYSGANLDYFLTIEGDEKLNLWANSAKERLEREIEKLFSKISDPLTVLATFSNGETVYRRSE